MGAVVFDSKPSFASAEEEVLRTRKTGMYQVFWVLVS